MKTIIHEYQGGIYPNYGTGGSGKVNNPTFGQAMCESKTKNPIPLFAYKKELADIPEMSYFTDPYHIPERGGYCVWKAVYRYGFLVEYGRHCKLPSMYSTHKKIEEEKYSELDDAVKAGSTSIQLKQINPYAAAWRCDEHPEWQVISFHTGYCQLGSIFWRNTFYELCHFDRCSSLFERYGAENQAALDKNGIEFLGIHQMTNDSLDNPILQLRMSYFHFKQNGQEIKIPFPNMEKFLGASVDKLLVRVPSKYWAFYQEFKHLFFKEQNFFNANGQEFRPVEYTRDDNPKYNWGSTYLGYGACGYTGSKPDPLMKLPRDFSINWETLEKTYKTPIGLAGGGDKNNYWIAGGNEVTYPFSRKDQFNVMPHEKKVKFIKTYLECYEQNHQFITFADI